MRKHPQSPHNSTTRTSLSTPEGFTMNIEVRQVSHPEAVRTFTTDELRRHFLIEALFATGEIVLTYSHIDRLVVGGAVPVAEPLLLTAPKCIGSPNFLDRRELGVVNLGGAGLVRTDGVVRE